MSDGFIHIAKETSLKMSSLIGSVRPFKLQNYPKTLDLSCIQDGVSDLEVVIPNLVYLYYFCLRQSRPSVLLGVEIVPQYFFASHLRFEAPWKQTLQIGLFQDYYVFNEVKCNKFSWTTIRSIRRMCHKFNFKGHTKG